MYETVLTYPSVQWNDNENVDVFVRLVFYMSTKRQLYMSKFPPFGKSMFTAGRMILQLVQHLGMNYFKALNGF